MASFQAAAQDFSRQNSGVTEATGRNGTASDGGSHDLSGVFTSAMKAAQRAGRVVDNMELTEKSEELERQ